MQVLLSHKRVGILTMVVNKMLYQSVGDALFSACRFQQPQNVISGFCREQLSKYTHTHTHTSSVSLFIALLQAYEYLHFFPLKLWLFLDDLPQEEHITLNSRIEDDSLLFPARPERPTASPRLYIVILLTSSYSIYAEDLGSRLVPSIFLLTSHGVKFVRDIARRCGVLQRHEP